MPSAPGGGGAVRNGQPDGRLAVRVVDDQQPLQGGREGVAGQVAAGFGGLVGPRVQLGAHQVGQRGRIRGDPPHRSAGVVLFLVSEVWQPPHPVPVGLPVRRVRDGHADIFGGVQRGRLGEQRTYHGEHAGPVADDAHVAGEVQRHPQRQPDDGAITAYQRLRLGHHERVGGLQRTALVLQVQRLRRERTGAGPQGQEVQVPAAAFPEPARVAYDVQQCGRRRVQLAGLGERLFLVVGQLFAEFLEVIQVAFALLPAGPGGLATLGEEHRAGRDHHQHHHQRTNAGQPGTAKDQHHRHRAAHAHHRQQGMHATEALALRQHRRRLHRAGVDHWSRLAQPGRPVHQACGHGILTVLRCLTGRWRARWRPRR